MNFTHFCGRHFVRGTRPVILRGLAISIVEGKGWMLGREGKMGLVDQLTYHALRIIQMSWGPGNV